MVMLNKLKANLQSRTKKQPDAPAVPGNHPIRDAVTLRNSVLASIGDIYRHRKQYGVNLGALFVGERWISDRLYACCDAGKSSELSAVTSFVQKHGLDKAKLEWESHWDSWITSKDVAYLAQNGINTVRLPLGYFSLSDPNLLEKTDFYKVASVYSGCWHYVDKLIKTCATYNIGVLLDLHALPGGQNGDAHSGTDSGKQDFYKSRTNRTQALSAIQTLILRAQTYENVVGVQVINEPSWGKQDFLIPFYTECLAFASQHSQMPLYIGDCWDPRFWSKWAGEQDCFCIVDHHSYYCFDERYHTQSPREISHDIRSSQELVEYAELARGNIIVGEWSLALDTSSKSLDDPATAQDARREFAAAQVNAHQAHSAGSFFWTFKFQVRNNDNEWDLRDMLDFGFLPCPMQPVIKLESNADELATRLDTIGEQKYSEHVAYWDQYTAQGQVYEHWRYKDGFSIGWNDALAFAQESSRIGFPGEWQKKRRAAHVLEKGDSAHIWEFEQGFSAGVKALESLFLA